MIKFFWILLFLATSLIFFVLNLFLGSVEIPLQEVLKILFLMPSQNDIWENIIWEIRFPRALTAILAGAGLSVGGLQMQTLFSNPLASPSLLGITSGASLGVALVIFASGSSVSFAVINEWSFLGSWLTIFSAMLGSALVLLLVLLISFRIKSNTVVLISGMMIGNLTLSLVGIWQYFSSPEQIQAYMMWTFGSLGGVHGQQLWVLFVAISIGIFGSFLLSKSLNILLLGSNYAQSLGMSVLQIRFWIILSTSLLAGSITAFCGPIGFVGIAVPHISRSLLGTSDHLWLTPASCLVGASLLLFCDLIAKINSQGALPINAVTALIGSPIVIWVVLNRKI